MNVIKSFALFVMMLSPCLPAPGQTEQLIKDLLYRENRDLSPYMQEKCRLDLYLPANRKAGFATVIFLHAGGLKQGKKYVPGKLRHQEYAVVAAGYRLHPQVKAPAYIEDAAAAVAWVKRHIAYYGGDPERIVLVGVSAGGYLASLITLDKSWLAPYDIDPDTFLGLAAISGQAITHFTVRKEAGIPATRPVVDPLAPLFHVRKDAPPILLVTGDRELELFGRYEETAYFMRMLKTAGHPDVHLHEIKEKNHSQLEAAAYPLLLDFLNRILQTE